MEAADIRDDGGGRNVNWADTMVAKSLSKYMGQQGKRQLRYGKTDMDASNTCDGKKEMRDNRDGGFG